MSNYVVVFPESKIPKNGEFGNHASFRSNVHRGVDFALPAGTLIPSFTSGTVVITQWSDVLGWVVVVEDIKGTFWGYCHMRAASSRKIGDKVVAGETILGAVGNTGSASQGAHLHHTYGTTRDSVFHGVTSDPIVALKIRVAREKPVKVEAPVAAPEAPKAAEKAPVAAPKVIKKTSSAKAV